MAWLKMEQEARQPRGPAAGAGALPLLAVVVAILLSPFLYDLANWLQHLLNGV